VWGQAKMQTQNTADVREKVHSQMVKAGNKNYFFDVKKTVKGSNYLTIAESYKNQKGERVINRVMLFKEHYPEFAGAITEVGQYLQ
jgi:hypothetical protein